MDFFESSIQNYKIAATSCYIFLFFSLFWLAHGFYFGDSRLPSNKCYQRGRFTLGQWCPVSNTESPGWSWFLHWSTVFWILFFEFHKACWIRFSTWESFIGFHLWGSPISMSLACLLCATLEIEFRGKRGVGMRTMGPGLRCHLVPPSILCIIFYGGWIWANYNETRTTTTNCRVSFIDFYLVFPTNFRIVFLPHTNTVI